MAGQFVKAAVRVFATMTVAFTFLAAQPQGIAALSGPIASGNSDSAITGTGSTSPQPAAKIPGSGNGPAAPSRGGTGSSGGTGSKSGGSSSSGSAGGSKSGSGHGTKSGDDGSAQAGTGNSVSGNTGNSVSGNSVSGDSVTGNTGNSVTGNSVSGDSVGHTASGDDDEEGEDVLRGDSPPTSVAPAADSPLDNTDVDNTQRDNTQIDNTQRDNTTTGGAAAGPQQQGGVVAGLQSLPSTSTPAGSPLVALTALVGALYAITRRIRS